MLKFCALLLLAYLALNDAAPSRDVRRVTSLGSSSRNYYATNTYNAPHKAQTKYSASGDKDVQILRNDQEMKTDGSYHYAYETSNGIAGAEQGVGGVSVQGSSSWISPEGVEVKTTYTADENGYHPVGDHIPQIPDYILRALEYIRAHPYQEKDYYSGQAKAAPSTYSKPTSSARRYQPAPTKYSGGAFGRNTKSGNRFKF